MNILLIYPQFPDTFWSFKHALKFVRKRSALPPLGLLTVAAMLPREWPVRLVDENVRALSAKDIDWADCAFVSAMTVQRESAREIISRCAGSKLRTVAGGPLFADELDSFPEVTHFVLNEAELTLPSFLRDLERNCAKKIYATREFADLRNTPAPRWDLLDMKRYACMSIQFSRGCPFACDFCNITAMLGRKVRTKDPDQIIAELDSLYKAGWRSDVFFVDDNFIGNKKSAKYGLLPKLAAWRVNKHGIAFNTQSSIDLAQDKELMDMMAAAGFNKVFIGIETPDEKCLQECGKSQNKNRDLVADVKLIQRAGLQVQGGFIVGFDSDQPSIFRRQIDFIQKSGIVTAMVGILQAVPGTRLYERLKGENRLSCELSGDNTDGCTNIVPAMNLGVLRRGYTDILKHIYSPKHYYQRVRTFLREFKPPRKSRRVGFSELLALARSSYRLGILGRERFQYWRLIFWTWKHSPRLLPEAVTLAVYGHHFRKICAKHRA